MCKKYPAQLAQRAQVIFFDTGLVEATLENLVAISLLKHAYAKTDYQAQEYARQYLRTKEGVEVDFALMLQDKVEQIIEVKLADSALKKSFLSFHNLFCNQCSRWISGPQNPELYKVKITS